MRWIIGILATAVGALALAGSASAAEFTVAVGNYFSFTPANLTINQGDTVTWRWVGPDTNHTVTSSPAGQADSFDSHPNNLTPGPPPSGEFGHTFNTAGTFTYLCRVHFAFMKGSVTVNPAPTPPSNSGGSTGSTPGTGAPTTAQGQPQSAAQLISKRRFRIRIRQPGGIKIASARVSVNGKPTPVSREVIDGKPRHTAEVDLRGLPRGTYRVDIVVTTESGKVLRGTRAYRTCVEKQVPSALPRL